MQDTQDGTKFMVHKQNAEKDHVQKNTREILWKYRRIKISQR